MWRGGKEAGGEGRALLHILHSSSLHHLFIIKNLIFIKKLSLMSVSDVTSETTF
jgi:hypothetical protein